MRYLILIFIIFCLGISFAYADFPMLKSVGVFSKGSGTPAGSHILLVDGLSNELYIDGSNNNLGIDGAN